MSLAGRFRVWHRHPDRGLLWAADLGNGVTTQGATHLLNRAFRGAAAQAWYLGVISAAGYSAVAAGDTHASHPGWAEYTGLTAARPAWPVAAAAQGGRLDSSATASVGVAASGSVRGVFLASRSPLGDASSAGVLYSTAVATASLAVTAGGILFVTYSLVARPGG